jgi:3',5'-cyclic AMP phosphodiesterase CpdA
LTEFVHEPGGGMTGTGRVLSESQVANFCCKVMAQKPDSVVITGDISTAEGLEVHLM